MNDHQPLRKALGSALNLISYRQRTEAELRQRLGARFDTQVIDQAVGRLKEQGLVDDAQFAHAWSASRARHSPRSSRAIARELTSKGIARPLAEAAVEDLDDDSTAREAAARFARRLADADYDQFHRRLWAHLMRRGYSGSVARRALVELWDRRRHERSADHNGKTLPIP